MSNLQIGPKVRPLTPKESLASLESWRSNVIYGLRLNKDFHPFLADGLIFGRKSRSKPFRDLTNDVKVERVDGNDVETIVKLKEEKAVLVDLILDQIANYAPVIPRNDIVKDCKSLSDVWTKIRQYYNKQVTGSLLNELWNIKRDFEETPQALFARMKQMADDNLLTVDGLNHIEGKVTEDEELSPTLHNYLILHWLHMLHPELRDLVTQRFITQLRDNTYAAIFPEISRSVVSLLDELSSGASACRTFPSSRQSPNQFRTYPHKSAGKPTYQSGYNKKVCEFCKATGKRYFYTHDISNCLFIKKINTDNSATAKQVEPESDDFDEVQYHYDEFYKSSEDACCQVEHVLNRVNIDASPVLDLEADDEQCEATLDTGATCNIMSEKKALKIKANIRKTNQRVRMADGQTSLDVVGETDVTLYRNHKPFHLSAIVCRHTDTDILAGMPFMKENDIAIRPFSDEIIINNEEYVKYSPHRKLTNPTSRRVVVHSSKNSVVLPGESEVFKVQGVSGNVAVEPRYDTYFNKKVCSDSQIWPKPQILPITDGHILLNNPTKEPVMIRKLEHICIIHPETEVHEPGVRTTIATPLPHNRLKSLKKSKFSDNVSVNPNNQLSKQEERSFTQLLSTYDQVFDPDIVQYNGRSGSCFVEVNLGPNLPVQRKGRLPFYGRNDLVELQEKFDSLVQQGVMSRPQDIGICVENINPSFLVRKQPPSVDKRLVTDFSTIANYCRPTPSLMPNVDSTLQSIASWKYLIKTDLSSAYYQIPLKKESKKFCGVHTPYKGLLVYNVGCMGLPGVEVALEELTCLLLGDMVKEGRVSKLADDLFIGGNSVQELIDTFKLVLQKLMENDIRLSAAKTIIAPTSVNILGWIWSEGSLKASPHKLNALSSCQQPQTVSGLKSYLGTYRFLSRVLKGYAKLLSPLEEAIKGKSLKDKLVWSDVLSTAFRRSQESLKDAKTITIPRPSDQLCIITDASIRPGAVGATLYAVREGRQMLAGFYNCKLPTFQSRWLPCEVEGLAIATSLNHFAPLIIQSDRKPQILTDSKPCVEAVQKLCRGEFSVSARLSSFLSSVSRYQAEVLHISGAANLPSDYQSRHPLKCDISQCSICKFAAETMESVVRLVTVDDILQGKSRIPFSNRQTWKEVQEQCSDLRRVKMFKSQGTVPSKKSKNLRTVRRYLSAGTLLAHDDVLVNPVSSPLGPVTERIVVPQQVLHGILTALHLQLNHPSAYQLTKAFTRYFFAIKVDRAISEVSKSCHTCASIKEVPKAMVEESSEFPPDAVGINFAADIVKRSSQKIFIIRESVTSYTLAEFVKDETVDSISQALICQCNLLRPSSTSKITIRLDPAPAHKSMYQSLSRDTSLSRNNINIEIGRELNKNKNPVIDKGIKELHRELLIMNPAGGPISSSQLSQAIATLNSRYRRSGMSSHELWTQRDQVTGDQLPIKDRDLIMTQYNERLRNHKHSQKSKASGKPFHPTPGVKVGSLVYIHSDRSKITARQRYLVCDLRAGWVFLRRFTSRLFGTKEYKAKLSECYVVPTIDHVTLPHQDDGDSSDDYAVGGHKQDEKDIVYSDKEKSRDESSEVETEDDLIPTHEDLVASEDEDSPEEERRPGRYTLDPVLTPPKNLTPASMDRPYRIRKKPDRYGAVTPQNPI